jgi:hypothetical protein
MVSFPEREAIVNTAAYVARGKEYGS